MTVSIANWAQLMRTPWGNTEIDDPTNASKEIHQTWKYVTYNEDYRRDINIKWHRITELMTQRAHDRIRTRNHHQLYF